MTSSLQVMEAHFSRKMFKEHISAEKSLDLMKLKLIKGANFQVPTWGTKSEKKQTKTFDTFKSLRACLLSVEKTFLGQLSSKFNEKSSLISRFFQCLRLCDTLCQGAERGFPANGLARSANRSPQTLQLGMLG